MNRYLLEVEERKEEHKTVEDREVGWTDFSAIS
jgi:hypothetical protein